MSSDATKMQVSTTQVREFTNLIAYETDENAYHFVGKNTQGNRMAKLLNQLQEDEQLFPLKPGVRPRRRGFHRIPLMHMDLEDLKDLREVTSHPNPCLVGPETRPLVFVNVKEATKSEDAEERPEYDDDTTFANNPGQIYDGARDPIWGPKYSK